MTMTQTETQTTIVDETDPRRIAFEIGRLLGQDPRDAGCFARSHVNADGTITISATTARHLAVLAGKSVEASQRREYEAGGQ